MEIQGIVKQILEPLTLQGRNGELKKFQFVIETQDHYPKKIHFQVFGEEKWQRMNVQQDQNVVVGFDISSREWNGKWYTQCDAWKVAQVVEQQNSTQQVVQQTQTQHQKTNQEQDDLPF